VQFSAVLFVVQRVGVILAVCGAVCFLRRVVWCFFSRSFKKKKKKKKSFEVVFRVNQRVGRWVLLSSVWLAVFDAVPWCGVSPRLWNPLAWTGSE